MTDNMLHFIRREELLPPGTPVVCALSGGADSVALLHGLLALRDTLQITVSAAHFHHGLRGAEADGDEVFVRQLCRQWSVPLTVGRGDCARYAAETGQSVEEAARNLRYGFLRALPGTVATAHNADDQVETVLLNLLRGTGLKGLCGMAPKQPGLVRPLLSVTRAEIEAYLQANGLPHREDSTNAEDDALRNRLRHAVTPLLRQENPSLARTVTRMTGLLRQEEDYLAQQTDALLQAARRENGWDCETLRQAPPVLRSRAVRRLLEIPKPAMHHVAQVESLLESLSGSSSVQLPGGTVALREYGLLRLTRPEPASPAVPVTLLPGNRIYLPWAGLWACLEKPEILKKSVDFSSTFALKYDMMDKAAGVCLRPRRTGDRLQLPGGGKTLKKLMIDRKLPAAQRDRIPVAEAGGCLAVCGLGADERLKARPGETAVILRFIQEERETWSTSST